MIYNYISIDLFEFLVVCFDLIEFFRVWIIRDRMIDGL